MARRIRSKDYHLWSARDGRRAALAALLLIFVAAASLSDGKLIPDFIRKGPSIAERTVSEPDEDLRTGSILIRPAAGNLCEHRLIDNATWRIHSDGFVRCDAVVTQQPHRDGELTPLMRIEAIRDGFVSKR